MKDFLQSLYEGPTELLLDEYFDLPTPYEDGAYFRAGRIRRKEHGMLEAEVWESRMPARFYKALLCNAEGRCVGFFSTGSGIGIALVLSDVCRALATGAAKFEAQQSSPWSSALLENGSVSCCSFLWFANEQLWTRVDECLRSGSLKFEAMSHDGT